MEQQTAVEWLIEQMKNGSFESWHTKKKWNVNYHAQEKTLEIAKAMEKEQIMKAVYDGMGTNFDPNMGRAEEYYTETYNK